METHTLNKRSGKSEWPRKVRNGRSAVTVYRRKTPAGSYAYMVANYAEGKKRRFDSYATEDEAIQQANLLAKRLGERQVLAAGMKNEDAVEYTSAIQALSPYGITLTAAISAVTGSLKVIGGDLGNLQTAVKFYAARNRLAQRKGVSTVVRELLEVKAGRGISERYQQDLRFRLRRFADAFRKDTCDVTTADVQVWLDAQKMAPQSYQNFRRVIHAFFEFAVARGYATDNPVASVECVDVRGGEVDIFTPTEMARLLEAASPEILPCLVLGAFAGLRSAEIERLEWSDIDLRGRYIVIGATKAKTASRRVVPISDNLAAWLAAYKGCNGLVWPHSHDEYYKAQRATARATEVKAGPESGNAAKDVVRWKNNALRHSYASYRLAEIGDAGKVAGELGNSAAVVHRHYKELVKPSEAKQWFSVKPEAPANITALPIAV